MKNFKWFKLKSNKAQISFELIVVLAVVSLIVSAIFIDFSKQANDSFILSNTKLIALNEINKKNIENNLNCSLKSMSFEGNEITLSIRGCSIPASLIADEVEKQYCQIKPNNDETIDCGEIYSLKVI